MTVARPKLTKPDIELLEPLGVGLTAESWLGHLEIGDQTTSVRVRLLRAELCENPAVVNMFLREARDARAMVHRGLVRVVGVGRVPTSTAAASGGRLAAGAPWVATEWLEAGPLAQHLERHGGALAWRDLRMIIHQVLHGLGWLHAHHLPHGSVHDRNILLHHDPGGLRAALSDAGAARVARAVRDHTDLTSTELPHLADLAELATVLRKLISPDLPPGFQAWVHRLAHGFTHAADAAHALGRLDGSRQRSSSGKAHWPQDTPPHPERWQDLPSASAPPSPTAGGEHGAPFPFSGRSEERSRLWTALRRVREDRRTGVVLIRGGAGVGKRALTQWLARSAMSAGLAHPMHARHGQVVGPDHGVGPMVGQFLGCAGLPITLARRIAHQRLERLGIGALPTREEIIDLFARVLPEVAGDLATPGRSLAPDEQVARLQLFLHGLTRTRPALVVVEDLQWGHETSELIRGLIAGAAHLPVLFVLTLRSDLMEAHPIVQRELDRLSERPEVGTIDVLPFAAAEQDAFFQEVCALEPGTAERLARLSQGVPLVAVQFLLELDSLGALVRQADGARLLGRRQLPTTDLKSVWLARLGRALEGRPPQDNAAVEIAALLGGDVDPEDWGSACEAAGVQRSSDLVDVLEDHGLAVGDRSGAMGRWSFCHITLVDAIERQSMRTGAAQQHHRAIAASLGAELADRAERSAPPTTGHDPAQMHRRLVAHLLNSGDLEAAIGPLLRAIATLVDAGQARAAEDLLHRGDACLQRLEHNPSDARRGEALLLQARVALLQARFQDASVLSTRAENGARRYGWDDVLAGTLLLRSNESRRTGDAEKAGQVLYDAEGIADDAGAIALRGACRLAMGSLAAEQGDLNEGRDLVQDALVDFEMARERRGLAKCLLTLGIIDRIAGRHAMATDRLREAHRRLEAAGSRDGLALALNALGDLARHSGDLDAATAHYQSALSSAQHRATEAWQRPTLNLALLDLARGRWRPARRALIQLLDDMQDGRGPAIWPLTHAALAAIAASERDWRSFDEHLDESRQHLRDSGFVDLDVAQMAQLAGGYALEAGYPRRARRAWRHAVRHLDALGDTKTSAEILDRIDQSRTPGDAETFQ